MMADTGTMMSVKFSVSSGQFIPEPPTRLFTGRFVSYETDRDWDVAPDGRFLMIQQPTAEEVLTRNQKIFPTTLRLVLNWMSPTTQTTINMGPGPAVPQIARNNNNNQNNNNV